MLKCFDSLVSHDSAQRIDNLHHRKKGSSAYSGLFGSIYTGPDPFGTGTKLVRISLVFTRDLVDLVRIGSATWYQMGPFMKVILCGTVPFQFRTGPM